jgi:hypothetical protein
VAGPRSTTAARPTLRLSSCVGIPRTMCLAAAAGRQAGKHSCACAHGGLSPLDKSPVEGEGGMLPQNVENPQPTDTAAHSCYACSRGMHPLPFLSHLNCRESSGGEGAKPGSPAKEAAFSGLPKNAPSAPSQPTRQGAGMPAPRPSATQQPKPARTYSTTSTQLREKGAQVRFVRMCVRLVWKGWGAGGGCLHGNVQWYMERRE